MSKISIPVFKAHSFKSRLFGLMRKKNITYGLFFYNCNAIHTFFMKENIDIIALNKNNEIIYIKENIKPNKIIFVKNKNKKTSILELPKHTSKNFKIGDKLLLEFKDII